MSATVQNQERIIKLLKVLIETVGNMSAEVSKEVKDKVDKVK